MFSGMRIQITDVCSEVLEDEFIVSKRGVIFVKVRVFNPNSEYLKFAMN